MLSILDTLRHSRSASTHDGQTAVQRKIFDFGLEPISLQQLLDLRPKLEGVDRLPHLRRRMQLFEDHILGGARHEVLDDGIQGKFRIGKFRRNEEVDAQEAVRGETIG